MLSAEVLVPLIIGVLGFLFKAYQESKEKKEQDTSVKLQELRKPLADNDTPGIAAALSDQHDRVQQEIRRGNGW